MVLYIGPLFFVVLLLHSRLRLLKSLLASTLKFYTSNCSKYSPNKHILDYLELTCFAYPAKLHSTSATFKGPHVTAAHHNSQTQTIHPAEWHDLHRKSPLWSPYLLGVPLPSSPNMWCLLIIGSGTSLAVKILPEHSDCPNSTQVTSLCATATHAFFFGQLWNPLTHYTI